MPSFHHPYLPFFISAPGLLALFLSAFERDSEVIECQHSEVRLVSDGPGRREMAGEILNQKSTKQS